MPADAGPLDSGRYRIGRLLGRGGLGEVYLARDCVLERDVAIKFLNPGKLPGGDARRALLREARAAAALDHPFICGIYEAAEADDGRAFIVMQHVEGQNLAELLHQGPMPVRDALALCADVAEALAAAHRRGVIHRDLKPGNIIVTPSGHPKIVDFGIAKVVPAVSGNAQASTVTDTTGFPALAGTPGYMSPEQLQGEGVDGRSDLFGLGLVLFECLTGRRAFQAPTPVETAAKILHVHPPPPSSLRPGLSEGHDELVRRLLAKNPADRFQSGDEVVGAIRVLLPDTSRTPSSDALPLPRPGPVRGRRRMTAAIAMVLVVLAAIGGWWWQTRPLPPVPQEADVWYRRGSEAVREGGYYRARKALEQAVAIYPQHPLAYARLAEVAAELDDPAAASEHLVRLSQLAVDERRLPKPEQWRLWAVRALVLRDVDRAVARYQSLVEETPREPSAFVDLGRAQEAAGRRADARASYEHALALNGQYAAAHLRRGMLESLDSNWEAALAAFGQAERLYRAASDLEGETQVLLGRGMMLVDKGGDRQAARRDLERALALAEESKSIYQKVKAELGLSIVTASEGRIADAERIASAAVAEALAKGLDTVAAGGLVDLAATLLFAQKDDLAAQQLERALQLAERRGAKLTAARAKIQLAEVYARGNRAADAVKVIDEVLPFLRNGRYRRNELEALSIQAGAQQRSGNPDEARRISSEVLAVADSIGDETQAAVAASSLANVTATLGNLPEALRLRDRAEAIHRKQGDRLALPYDLTNRAELLSRLGRGSDADAALDEVQAGIAAGLESYVGRERRATLLRALNAATQLRCGDALPLLDRLLADASANDSAAGLAPALQRFCHARTGRRVAGVLSPASPSLDRAVARERQYWAAAAALQAGDLASALAEARQGLSLLGDLPNDELRWRLAAIGATAARRRGEADAAARLATASRESLARLRGAWKTDAEHYERRPDLAEMVKKEQS